MDDEDMEMVAVNPTFVCSHDPLAPHVQTSQEENAAFALRTKGEKGTGDANNNVPELNQVLLKCN